MSDSYQRQQNLPIDCLRSKVTQPFTHDAYFHSVLGLMDVKTEAYNTELDMFAACRKPAAAG